MGDSAEQLNCFGIGTQWFSKLFLLKIIFHFVDFPETCPTYYGTHSMDCLVTIWDMVRCLKSGRGYPEKLPADRVLTLTSTNYSWVDFDLVP